jgi:N-acetylmuramoyl-L-alanine amidase
VAKAALRRKIWEVALKFRPFLLVMTCLLASFVLQAGAALARPEIVDARIGDTAERTRFVLEMTEDLPYRVFTLPDPFRVVLDLPEVAWTLPGGAPPPARGLITALRFGLFAPGTTRVVLDMKSPVLLQQVFVIPPRDGKPYRLVIDIEAASREQYFAAESAATGEAAVSDEPLRPLAEAVPALPQPKPADERPMVVIDPGHGGVDPGAVGVSGYYEKNLTLDYGRALQRALAATGRYRVAITRERDVFLKLRERIGVAQEVKGDLFISLHANVHSSGNIRGASIYTLSETASDEEAAALAAAENAADVLAGVNLGDQTGDVRNILIDLAQRETMNLSKKFANDLVREVGRETKLLRNTHRFAGFAVLKSPVVPSILFEIGYMSNRQEERLLRSEAHREKIIESIIRAIDGYFERQRAASRS